jgi:hypothetical protein
MTISIKIFLLAIFVLSGSAGIAQLAPEKDDTREVEQNKREAVTDTRNANVKIDDNKQAQNAGNKNGSLKQVKYARPDMSRSRGARPPDIVRPSGSRIPKGVGRPAGAIRHGRG